MELKNVKNILDLQNLPDTSKLNECTERSPCPKCNRSVKFFCYKCLIPVGMRPEDLPELDPLPTHLDIIKHNKEVDGKSTALHAKILAPKSVSIWSYPDELPEVENPENCLLLFPGPNSITIEEAMKRIKEKNNKSKEEAKSGEETSNNNSAKIERIVVIDGTWSQANAMVLYSPLISKFQKVQFTYPYTTTFWRYQKFSENYLATIEAIYFFYREYLNFSEVKYDLNLDNILYFYKYFYDLIQDRYNNNRGLKFCHRHKGFVKYRDGEEGDTTATNSEVNSDADVKEDGVKKTKLN